LTFEVPRHEALAQKFHTVHLGFDAATAVVSAPSSPERTAQIFRRPQGFIARDGTCGDRLPWIGVFAWRYDGMGSTFGNGIFALPGVVGTVGCDAGDLLIGRDLASSLGSMGASPISLLVTFNALTFSVSSSIPRWILRQTRRFGPPCVQAFHSPSPSTLIPLLSIKRCSGPTDPRYGILTFRVFWRQLSVPKFGTVQFRSINRSKLSTKPVVCLKAMPNSTFIVRHVWIAASL